jgi:hypothetical protein
MRMSNETLVVVALAAFALIYYLQTYGSKKSTSGMTNSGQASSNGGASSDGGVSSYGSPISDINTSTYGMQTDYTQKPTANESLLPKDSNGQWASMNPAGTDQLKNVDLTPFQIIGMVAQSKRNVILDIRGETPQAKQNVGPWMNSTIETTPNMNNIFKDTSGKGSA